MLEVAGVILFLYISLLLLMIYEINKTNEIAYQKIITPKQKFSILIPFKNEEKNLGPLIYSLNQLKYPKQNFEVIFINDHSTDNGAKIIKNKTKVPYLILDSYKKSLAPKKEALEKGIEYAEFDFIITTDADCIVPQNWLLSYNQFIQQKKPKMILGPVKYKNSKKILEQFQLLEFLSLQAFTIGSLKLGYPFLSNGANLGFEKESFIKLGGYKGNKHIASGDDVFLLEKFRKRFPDKIYFLKSPEAIVETLPQEHWKQLYNQKLRWASKSKEIKNVFGQMVGGIILAVNLLGLFLLFLFWYNPLIWLSYWGIKLLFDLIFIFYVNKFYQNKINYNNLIISSLLYPLYSLIILMGLVQKKYTWKDNKYTA